MDRDKKSIIVNISIHTLVIATQPMVIFIYRRVGKDTGMGAEVYTSMLQKNMTPYITTQVGIFIYFLFSILSRNIASQTLLH